MNSDQSSADFTPTEKDLHKAAAFTLGTALAAPTIGLNQEQVKRAGHILMTALEKRAARHRSLVDMLRQHVQGSAGATA